MSQLSEKELSGMGDLLSGEALLVKKFQLLADTTTDPTLKQQFADISAKHQTHVDKLYALLK